MKFTLNYGLPFVELVIEHKGQQLNVGNVLVDTGSATTVFSTDLLAEIDLKPEYDDDVHRISGVGGYEYVIRKTVDRIYFDDVSIQYQSIQLGDLDYGFEIHGIIGSDILNKIGAVVDFSAGTLTLK